MIFLIEPHPHLRLPVNFIFVVKMVKGLPERVCSRNPQISRPVEVQWAPSPLSQLKDLSRI